MNIYTVSFFGHRYIERGTEIEKRLDKLLHDLITQKEYVTSWSDGTEILICLLLLPLSELSAVTITAISILHLSCHIWKRSTVPTKRSTLTIMMKSRCVLNRPKRTRSLLSKSAIGAMIDRSDLVVCCIQHKSGVAYRTIQYAEKQGKKIVNLAEKTE